MAGNAVALMRERLLSREQFGLTSGSIGSGCRVRRLEDPPFSPCPTELLLSALTANW